MKNRSRGFVAADVFFCLMMIAPIIAGIIIKVLTSPASSGVEITGAKIFFTLKMPLQDLPVTEAQVNSFLVIIIVLGACLFLTHGINSRRPTRRQLIAEWIVEKTDSLVSENMGAHFSGFAPFVGAILGLSAFSSLLSLFGLFPPTSDLNIVGGWAVLVFILITYYKFKCGPVHYLKSFLEPVPLFAPMNIISEIATPVSMSFRHYGNVLSGTVISALVAAGLQGLSGLLLSWLPGVLGEIPFLQIGIPAVLSIYFDVFSGCLQAFIFAMLTMLYVSGGFPAEEWEERQKKKVKKTISKN